MFQSSAIRFAAIPFVLFLQTSSLLRADDVAAEPGKQLVARMQPFVDSHTLAGAVMLVASKEKVLTVQTVGYSDIEANKKMQPDSLVWIASMTKPITATALMILVDEGKVALDDPVEKHLPEFKDQWMISEQDSEHMLLKKPKQPITVRKILSHTSGMPFKSILEQPTLDITVLADAARSYAITPLISQPGTAYLYSNAGINTAGRIIEVVSGMPYEDFMQKRLFDPLGMKDTSFWPNEQQTARLAKTYKPGPNQMGLEETSITYLRYPLSDRRRQPMPGGGLFSTAADLGNFCRMILAGGTFNGQRYLSEKSIAEMATSQTGDLPVVYGLGWSTEKRANSTFGHGGAYSTQMSIDRDKQLVLIYLVQHAGYPAPDGPKVYPEFVKAAGELFGK